MNENVTRMLNLEDKGVSEAHGILAQLFRNMMLDINLTEMGWSNLMERYLNDPVNRIPRNGKDISSARGNLNKELTRDSMTWKVFCKGLSFLGIKVVKFQVLAEWDAMAPTVHSVTVNVTQLSDEDSENEEELLNRLAIPRPNAPSYSAPTAPLPPNPIFDMDDLQKQWLATVEKKNRLLQESSVTHVKQPDSKT